MISEFEINCSANFLWNTFDGRLGEWGYEREGELWEPGVAADPCGHAPRGQGAAGENKLQLDDQLSGAQEVGVDHIR